MRHAFAATILVLITAAGLDASTSARTNIRLDPGDSWCPTGLTFDEGRTDLLPSAPGVFDRGDLETSFRVPANNWVYVTLTTNMDISIDNIMAVHREQLFPPGTAFFDSELCHQDFSSEYPMVRVRTFDTSSPPPGVWLEEFAMTDLDVLKDQGWELGEAVLDTFGGAVEALNLNDQGAVVEDCPSGGAACPNATGSLMMPAGSRIRFPLFLTGGEDYVLQLWWNAPEGARLDVRVDDFSSCPSPPEGIFVEHSSQIEVEILDATLKRGIDPEIFALFAFIEDQSDTFGRVTIDGIEHDVPQIDGDDDPTWDGTAKFAAGDLSDPSIIPIKIEMWDNDEFDNAHVDLDADPADKDLDLVVDLCRLEVSGDLSSDLQGVLTARGDQGSGDDEGLLHFRISTPTGRPVSTDDLALVDVDFVQAVHRSQYAVTEKPGVVMVSVANNFSTPISTEVLVEIYGPGGFWKTRTFPIDLDSDSTSTFYFFNDAPVYPPSPTPGIESFLGINAHVDPTGVYAAGLPSGDCRLDNDLVSEKFWKIAETSPLVLSWAKAGRLGDLPSLVSDAKRDDVRDLGTTFIRATFPTASVTSSDWPLPVPSTPALPAIEFITAILKRFKIPGSGMPFAIVWDMNTFAALSGVDHFMGVLPSSDWYIQFEGWENVPGNSLGEAAPHAVIFVPEVEEDDGDKHVKLTLPGHELAHTFGVSADPRLKDTATCGVTLLWDPFGIGDLICGATGGIDEYSSPDPARANGNPATGYWVQLGTEDPRMAGLTDLPQCDRHCFMGRTKPDQLDNWTANGRWIDTNDWDHLVRRLKTHPDPEIIFVGGMIDPSDNIHLSPFFRIPAGIPDRVDDDPGGYRVRFYDSNDDLLQDIGFPATFGASHSIETPPITFFGFTVPWVADTARIDIDRGELDSGAPPTNLASILVSENPPQIQIIEPQAGASYSSDDDIDLLWDATDPDGDDLSAVVMASTDGDHWGVVHGWVVGGETSATIPAGSLPPGPVQIRINVTDGVHMTESGVIEIIHAGLFTDGFESGNTTAWSVATP